MKRFVCVLTLCLLSTSAFAQEKPADDSSKAMTALQDQVKALQAKADEQAKKADEREKTLTAQLSAIVQQLQQQESAKPAPAPKTIRKSFEDRCQALGAKGLATMTLDAKGAVTAFTCRF